MIKKIKTALWDVLLAVGEFRAHNLKANRTYWY
jgi:hypothetical protein